LNKGKRYIRLKIPSDCSQKANVGGTSQLPRLYRVFQQEVKAKTLRRAGQEAPTLAGAAPAGLPRQQKEAKEEKTRGLQTPK